MFIKFGCTLITPRVLNATAEQVAPYMQFDQLGATPVLGDAFANIACTGNTIGSDRDITLKEPAGHVLKET